MRILIRSSVLVLVLCTLSTPAVGVSNALKAKSDVMLAESKIQAGDFDSAATLLENARTLLGKTDSKIQYLLTECYYQLKHYPQARKELEKYFEITPEDTEDKNQFNTMVTLISRIEEGLQGKNPTPLSLTGTPSSTASPSSPRADVNAEKWITLEEARTNGVPVPHPNEYLKFKEGRTIVTQVVQKGITEKSEPGLFIAKITNMNVNVNLTYTNTFDIMNPDGLSYRGSITKTDNVDPSQSATSEVNWSLEFQKNPSFPVPLLRTGISWTEKQQLRYNMKNERSNIRRIIPVEMQVEEFTTLNGHDCVKITGKGSFIIERNVKVSMEVDSCYDYNHGIYLYNKKHYTKTEGDLTHADIIEEYRLVSLTDK